VPYLAKTLLTSISLPFYFNKSYLCQYFFIQVATIGFHQKSGNRIIYIYSGIVAISTQYNDILVKSTIMIESLIQIQIHIQIKY
jgi:hypothetical protein